MLIDAGRGCAAVVSLEATVLVKEVDANATVANLDTDSTRRWRCLPSGRAFAGSLEQAAMSRTGRSSNHDADAWLRLELERNGLICGRDYLEDQCICCRAESQRCCGVVGAALSIATPLHKLRSTCSAR